MLTDPVRESLLLHPLVKQKGGLQRLTFESYIQNREVTDSYRFLANNSNLDMGSTRTKIETDKGTRYAY